MRILVIEDEVLVGRFIYYQLLQFFSCDVQLVTVADEADSAVGKFLPHLILCDIDLNATVNGVELVEALQSKYHFELVFVTSYGVPEMIDRAAVRNPVQYLIKPFTKDQFYATVKMAIQIAENNPKAGTSRVRIMELLTKMEYEILAAIVKNKTTKQIADDFFISPSTVKNHRHNICRKLDLEPGNNAIIKWVMDQGLLQELS